MLEWNCHNAIDLEAAGHATNTYVMYHGHYNITFNTTTHLHLLKTLCNFNTIFTQSIGFDLCTLYDKAGNKMIKNPKNARCASHDKSIISIS